MVLEATIIYTYASVDDANLVIYRSSFGSGEGLRTQYSPSELLLAHSAGDTAESQRSEALILTEKRP